MSRGTQIRRYLIALTTGVTCLAWSASAAVAEESPAGSKDDQEILQSFGNFYEGFSAASSEGTRPKPNRAATVISTPKKVEDEIDQLFERITTEAEEKQEFFWKELTRMEFTADGDVRYADPSAPKEDDNSPDPILDAILAEIDNSKPVPLEENATEYQGPYNPDFKPEMEEPKTETVIPGSGPKEILFPGKKKEKDQKPAIKKTEPKKP